MESNRTNFDFLKEIEKPFKVNVIKEGEEDKYIVTCGNKDVFPFRFKEREQAEAFIETKLFDGFQYMAIAALCIELCEKFDEYRETKGYQLKNEFAKQQYKQEFGKEL